MHLDIRRDSHCWARCWQVTDLDGSARAYQLLAYLARERPNEFSTKQLADRIKRTPEHTRSEIDKLIELGVLEQVGNDRKTRLYGITDSTLSEELLDLPGVLVEQLCRYRRPRA